MVAVEDMQKCTLMPEEGKIIERMAEAWEEVDQPSALEEGLRGFRGMRNDCSVSGG